MKEWFTPAELAARKLPGLPGTARGIRLIAEDENWCAVRNAAGEPLARRRAGRGGGWKYHFTLLPSLALARIVADSKTPDHPPEAPGAPVIDVQEAWANFERVTAKRQSQAAERAHILDCVKALQKGGLNKNLAVCLMAKDHGVSPRTVYNWFDMVGGVDRKDWPAYLVARYSGRNASEYCDPRAFDFLKADYLRLEQPSFQSCYRRLERAAEAHGWTIQSARTLERRLDRSIPAAVRVLAREGREALKHAYPAQERDKSGLHALQAVNADGHKWDVWVVWPDGEVTRPCIVAFQDVYSGLIVSWRIDKTENKEVVRLAFGDMVESYGIPDTAYLDNGRSFASKWITGGTPDRFRFKAKEDDPLGVMTTLGVHVRFTTPYSGQSKPVERAFRDFCDNISKHPALAGAWTGNSPMNKPENYGSREIPLTNFLEVVADGIAEHNTRRGRRSPTAAGRSFLETFDESYARAPIRKATEQQRRLWLMAAEGVRVSSRDGSINFLDNRYWTERLLEYQGKPVVVRFDPQDLQGGIHVYRRDGVYLTFAECIEAAGFEDVDAAREHARARSAWMKAQRAMLAAEQKLTIDQVAELLPNVAANHAPPKNKVTRPVFGQAAGNTALKQQNERQADMDADEFTESFKKGVALLRLVKEEEQI